MCSHLRLCAKLGDAPVRNELYSIAEGHREPAYDALLHLRPGAQGNEGTIVRYVMPADSGYELEQDAVYTLPVRGGGPIDIAESTSLLWMALNHQVRSGWTIGMRLAQLSS